MMAVVSLDEPTDELPFEPAAPGVEITLVLDVFAYDPAVFPEEDPRWMSLATASGHYFGPEGLPDFPDAAEAVSWWRTAGARDVRVCLEPLPDGRLYWAGEGPPPIDEVDGRPLMLFSSEDARGTPRGALETRDRAIKRWEIEVGHMVHRGDIHCGEKLRERREAAGLGLETVAARVNCTVEQVEGIEAGTSPSHDIVLWSKLVWATGADWGTEPAIEVAIAEQAGAVRGWTGLDRFDLARQLVTAVTSQRAGPPEGGGQMESPRSPRMSP